MVVCSCCGGDFKNAGVLKIHQKKECRKVLSTSNAAAQMTNQPGSKNFDRPLLNKNRLSPSLQTLLDNKFNFSNGETLYERITNFRASGLNVFTSIVYILLAPYLAEQSKISIFPGFVFDPQKFLVFLSSIIYIGRSTTSDRVFKHDENNGVSNVSID